MQANLNQSSSTGVCTGLDDFYKQKMSEKKGDFAKKGEATENLRKCRTAFSPQTAVRINTKDTVTPVDGTAANRAAAVIYGTTRARKLNSAYDWLVAEEKRDDDPNNPPKVWNKPTDVKPPVVRSMAEFYEIQKKRRLSDERKKAFAMKEYHEYNGKGEVRLLSRNDLPVPRSEVCKTASRDPTIRVNYFGSDYRGFAFVVHNEHGLLLLFCSRKKNKSPHYQLAGGHIDGPEFLEAAKTSQDSHTQLLLAAQMGTARELFEETGMDLRDQLHRLEPAALRSEEKTNKNGEFILTCEHHKRLYFFLQVTDEDFPTGVHGRLGFTRPKTEAGKELLLKLSREHQGFCFEKDPTKAAEMLRSHSGGKGSEALLMAMSKNMLVNEDEARKLIAVSPIESSVAQDHQSIHRAAPELVDLLSDDSTKHPVEILPRPEKKNIFSCCFPTGQC